jgi:uncharacterized protein YihD (DUF1040 family)
MFQEFAYSQSKINLKSSGSNSSPNLNWAPSEGFKRGVLLSHGRELVNGVVMYEAKLDDAAKTRILIAGVRSLEAAGDSEDDVDLKLLRARKVGGIEDGIDGHEERIWKGFVALGFDKA